MSDTIDGYNRWAPSYDSYDNPMIGAAAWALGTVPLACKDRDVLELGCGTGRHIAGLLRAGARAYVGFDGASEMLRLARQRNMDGRVQLVEGDLLRPLPFDDASFDCALIVLVLEHLPALAGLFAELSRVLRPKGVARIVELHPARIVAGTAAHFRDAGGEVRFDSVAHSVAGMVEALARVGLRPRAVREYLAEGELLAQVPKLAKHEGLPVLLDIEAEVGGS